jgi:ribosomal protein S18 acetylase RimI-like enzyme
VAPRSSDLRRMCWQAEARVSTPITLDTAAAADEAFLWEMLVEAAHLAADGDASAVAAQQHPFLAKFVRGWGRPGDLGVIARDTTGEQLGAAWVRHLTGPEQSYPTVNPAYPELAIAVRPQHSGRGLGGALLDQLITLAQPVYPGLVLSVRAENPAQRLYARHGFVVTGEIVNRVGSRSLVMERRLDR